MSRRRQAWWAPLFALVFFTGPAPAVDISGGSEEDRAALVAISEDWVEAYGNGDIELMMSLMHADAMVMAENQPTVRGYDAVRAYFAPRVGAPGITFTDDLQEIRIEGDWAFVRGEFVLEVAAREPDGQPFKRKGRYFVLYEKNDQGEWKMLRDIDNAAPLTSDE